MAMSWVYLKDEDSGPLTEIQLETPKEMSLAHLSADQMAIQMALLSDYCWVYPMEQLTEILMAMRMAMHLAYLSVVLKAMRMVWQMENDSEQLMEMLKATRLVR